MSWYKEISEGDRPLEEFPGLSQEELDEVDGLFQNYLVFDNETKGRRVWTSCCHVNGRFFPGEGQRIEGPEAWYVNIMDHNDDLNCPFCGQPVKVKNRKLMKSTWRWEEYHPVVFLHVSPDGETVWAQGYWAMKDHRIDPAGMPLYKVTRIYRFRRGETLQWERAYCDDAWKMDLCKGRKWAQEPATSGGMFPKTDAYRVIGLERLKESFLAYTLYDVPLEEWELKRWEQERLRRDLMRYLWVAALWPEQVELLRKAGMNDPVWDLVYKGKKNDDVLKWGEKDPCKAFGLTKEELRDFLRTEKNMDVLRVHHLLTKAGARPSIPQAQALYRRVEVERIRDLTRRARKYRVPMGKLLGYLERFTEQGCRGNRVTLGHVCMIWRDYMDAAARLGYDMANPIHQMPKDLHRKHDEAAQALAAIIREENAARADKLAKKLEKKYGFAQGGYFIRPPCSAGEIVAEGKALKHCVGGYADRYVDGTVVILFLRKVAEPDVPYVTIEMKGNDIVQVHGYRNDAGKEPARRTHKKLLDTWVAWLKAGSKRNEEGEPVLPKKKQKKETNAA